MSSNRRGFDLEDESVRRKLCREILELITRS